MTIHKLAAMYTHRFAVVAAGGGTLAHQLNLTAAEITERRGRNFFSNSHFLVLKLWLLCEILSHFTSLHFTKFKKF